MFILKNEVTGKELKLKDKTAKEVFGLTEKLSYLFCLPAKKIVHTNNVGLSLQTLHERKRKIKIGGTCVIRMGGIGDLIMLSSSLVKIKKKYPGNSLTLATVAKYVPIMKDLKGIDLCISIDDLDKYSFDKVIDLRYAVEPSNIGPGSLSWRDYVSNDRSDNFDKLCGVNSRRKYFNIPINAVLQRQYQKRTLNIGKPVIGLCPTTASPVRVMPPEYVTPLIKMIENHIGGTIVLIGKTEDWNKQLTKIHGNNIANMLDITSEQELIALCSLMDLIISPDTGVLHIAGALRKKTIGLFGCINPLTRGSYYRNMKAIYPEGELPCVPCHDVPGACDYDKPGAPCMRLITPARIMKTVRELL